MKKMFFTAMAVVAFSGVSVAKTKEVKVTKGKSKVVFVSKQCDAAGSAAARAYYQSVYDSTGGIGDFDVAQKIRKATVSACEAALAEA